MEGLQHCARAKASPQRLGTEPAALSYIARFVLEEHSDSNAQDRLTEKHIEVEKSRH